MSHTATIKLPGGLWLDGVCHQEVGLRPLTGDDEAFLLETGESLFPVQQTTALLARCLTHLGPLTPVTPDTVRLRTVSGVTGVRGPRSHPTRSAISPWATAKRCSCTCAV
jgi:hypothetical protein